MSALFLCQLHNIQPLTQPNPPWESDTEMLTDEQQREIRKEKQGRRDEERFSLLQALLVLQRQVVATRPQFRQAPARVLLVVRPAFIFRALKTSVSNKQELKIKGQMKEKPSIGWRGKVPSFVICHCRTVRKGSSASYHCGGC